MGKDKSTVALTNVQTSASLEDAKQFLTALEEPGSEATEFVSRLAGLTALFVATAVVGPVAIGLITVKNEVRQAFDAFVAFISQRDASTDPERTEMLRHLHTVVVHTSAAAALSDVLDALDIKDEEIAQGWLTAIAAGAEVDQSTGEFAGRPFELPHPVWTEDLASADVKSYFSEAGERLTQRVKASPSYAAASTTEAESDLIDAALASFVTWSQGHYRDILFDLAVSHEEFAIWSRLVAAEWSDQQLVGISDSLHAHIEEAARSRESADRAFGRLEALVDRLPARMEEERVDQVLTDLLQRSTAELARPVIEDPGDADHVAISYPSKADAFIPQRYRAIRYRKGSTRLESEALWRATPESADIGQFVLRFLLSPYSVKSPLLVLGHPGSGKSLLTQILATRLAPPLFNVIRVELRDAEPDDAIQNLIEAAILRQCGTPTNWVDLSRTMDAPPVIIFDGFDELLQATGQVHRNFLRKVQAFQTREGQLGRRVTTVITSRVVLIDKAEVPDDTTVVRLMPFDEAQVQQWVELWNQSNASFFASRHLRKFEPKLDEGSISDLAREPLLLLMLAVYDAHANELYSSEGLNRTDLYESLLLRFVEREHSKDTDGFLAKSPDQQQTDLQATVHELSAVAMGMFNRRSLASSRSQVSGDLATLTQGVAPEEEAQGRLTAAELIVGSFFFVHEARVGDANDAEPTFASFEFLHNTFGEYLAARFIVEEIVGCCKALETLPLDLVEIRSNHVRDLTFGWYGGLSHAAIHERPVIAAMANERLPEELENQGLTKSVFDARLAEIVGNEIVRMLAGPDSVPALLTQQAAFGDQSAVERTATYLANLLVVSAREPGNQMVLADPSIDIHRLWQRAIGILRAGFTTGALEQLTNLVHVSVDTAAGLVAIAPAENASNDFDSRELRVATALCDRELRGRLARSQVQTGALTPGLARLLVIPDEDVDNYLQDPVYDWLKEVTARNVPVTIRRELVELFEDRKVAAKSVFGLEEIWFASNYFTEEQVLPTNHLVMPIDPRTWSSQKGRTLNRSAILTRGANSKLICHTFEIPDVLHWMLMLFRDLRQEPGPVTAPPSTSGLRQRVVDRASHYDLDEVAQHLTSDPAAHEAVGSQADSLLPLVGAHFESGSMVEWAEEWPESVALLAAVGTAFDFPNAEVTFRTATEIAARAPFSRRFPEEVITTLFWLQRRDLADFVAACLPGPPNGAYSGKYANQLVNYVAAGANLESLPLDTALALAWATDEPLATLLGDMDQTAT